MFPLSAPPSLVSRRSTAGEEKDLASKEEIGGPRATRCFMQLNNVPGGPCGHCGTSTSSAWRKGPVGKKELCNQCGARYIQKGTLHGFFPMQRGGVKAGALSGSPPCRVGASAAAQNYTSTYVDRDQNEVEMPPNVSQSLIMGSPVLVPRR